MSGKLRGCCKTFESWVAGYHVRQLSQKIAVGSIGGELAGCLEQLIFNGGICCPQPIPECRPEFSRFPTVFCRDIENFLNFSNIFAVTNNINKLLPGFLVQIFPLPKQKVDRDQPEFLVFEWWWERRIQGSVTDRFP